jgi:hypothetical protein
MELSLLVTWYGIVQGESGFDRVDDAAPNNSEPVDIATLCVEGTGHLTARDDGLAQLDGESRISDYCSFDAGDVQMAC